MHQLYIFLILNLLKISTILCGETETENSTNELQVYLPFAMMHRKDGSYLFPNAIESGTFKENIGFTGELQFSKYDVTDEQTFFCPANTDEEKAKIKQANSLFNSDIKFHKFFGYKEIDDRCLLDKKFEKLDILRCSLEAFPKLRIEYKIIDNETKIIPCGPDQKGSMYKFIYETCPSITFQERAKLVTSNSRSLSTMNFFRKTPFLFKEIIVYEICFNMDAKGTIYTKHTLSSLPLLFDERLQHEKARKFEMSTNTIYHSYFFDKVKYFYKELETPDETGKAKEPFKGHFMVSPDDMPTALLRKPLFHYINMKPIHENLIALWEFIEDTIRRAFKDTNIPYDVYTGAFLASNKQNYSKIPDLWIRILYYDYKSKTTLNPSIVIIMKNNDPSSTSDISLENYCPVDYCSPQRNGNIIEKKFPGAENILQCCLLNPKIQEIFGLNLKGETILEIPGLTKKV